MPAAIAVVAIAILAFRLTVPLPPPKSLGLRSGYERWSSQTLARMLLRSLVTDGSRLYFVESPFVSPILKQVSTLGGETSAIATPFLVNLIGDISPDRSSLLIPALSVSQENDAAALGITPSRGDAPPLGRTAWP